MIFKLLTLVVGLTLSVDAKFHPYWWNETKVDGAKGGYGVLTNASQGIREDAPVKARYLKHFVLRTKAYFDDYAKVGLAPDLQELVSKPWFTDSDDNAELTEGQLKYVVELIYDELTKLYPSDELHGISFKPEIWDTDWLVKDNHKYLDPTIGKLTSSWKVASPGLWRTQVNSPYPWTLKKTDDKHAAPATFGQLTSFFSFELPEIYEKDYQGRKNFNFWTGGGLSLAPNRVHKIRHGYHATGKNYTDTSGVHTVQFQEIYAPTLSKTSVAPLYIILPGGPRPWNKGANINNSAIRYFAMTGEHRAHYVILSSSSTSQEGFGADIMRRVDHDGDPSTPLVKTPSALTTVIGDLIAGGPADLPMQVDPDRVYLIGFSYGGGSIQRLLEETPSRYAAAMLISPAAFMRSKTEPQWDEYADLVGHVPMMWIRGANETNRGVYTVPEFESIAAHLRKKNPETFLLRVPGSHGRDYYYALNQFENFKWLHQQRRK